MGEEVRGEVTMDSGGTMIREFRRSDLESIEKLIAGLHPDWFTEEALENIPRDIQFARCFVSERDAQVTGFVSVRVGRVLPNGDLVVAGQKTVMINRERQILTLVGSVRPVDIDAHNRVQSAQVGDLTVRLWGKGEVDDTVREGWFMRIMKRIWPF